jgi:hypothetical protein
MSDLDPGEELTISLPGAADEVVRSGGWDQDSPQAFARYTDGRSGARGRGWVYTTTMTREQWIDLGDYLASVRQALAGMTREERGSGSDLRGIVAALERISGRTKATFG